MAVPDFVWVAYEIPESAEGAPGGVAPAEAAPVTVFIPDLSRWPQAGDKAKILLETAAEVEHALLAQYLYAAFSLKGRGEVTDEAQKDALGKWFRLVRGIAIEEMAHLVTVQNLLLAIRLLPNLEREDYPPPEGLYPFELHLQPLTQRSLAKYVTAEAPEDATGIDDIIKQAKEKEGAPINRVGTIYGLLGVVFSTEQQIIAGGSGSQSWDQVLRRIAAAAYRQNSDRSAWHLGDDAIDPQTLAFQADPDDWSTSDLIGTRDTARSAIRQIGEQGEGPTSSGRESHFERFLRMYRGGNGMPPFPKAGEWTPTRAVPTDPVTAAITEPRTQRWAKLADLRYELLLGFIEHYLRTSEVTNRIRLARWAFEEMRTLPRLSEKLVTLPLKPGVAALPFKMPRELHLPPTEAQRWLLQRDRTNAAIRHVQQMQAADPEDAANDTLSGLLTDDAERLTLMPASAPL